ncbi:alginate export family protein [Paenirhodobacter sp.]|uniref:alginate export family protein n=1 Tax=Paenirhodobacter sp. TaxID=1965326 RepID=UPI003B3D3138
MNRLPAGLAACMALSAPALAEDSRLETQFQLGWESEYEGNFDLDDDDRADVNAHELTLRGTLRYRHSETVRARLEAEAALIRDYTQGERVDRIERLKINQAWIGIEAYDGGEIQLGRFQLRDPREWLFDENLDGLRLLHEGGRVAFDLSLSRADMWHRDLLDPRSTGEPVNNLAALADVEVRDGLWLGGYAVLRDDRSKGDRSGRDRPLHLGLRSHGALTGAVEHWADLAFVRGTDGTRPLRGHALTAGATWTLGARRLTLGYAWASGDDDPQDNRNTEFRQTGLQSNEGRFGAGSKLSYYGAGFDPELSNMAILTAGLGMNPTETLALDLVYNRFRQVEASDTLRDSALDADPDGISRDLGEEIDLVLTYEPDEDREFQLVLGYFRPGDAFGAADDALYARLEFELRF